MENKGKSERIYLRVSEDMKDYIEQAAKFHDCTITDFILKQCTQEEFVQIEFSKIDEVQRLLANIANNLNQIARALNIANKKEKILPKNEIEELKKLFYKVENILNENGMIADEKIKELYKIVKTKKIRSLETNDS